MTGRTPYKLPTFLFELILPKESMAKTLALLFEALKYAGDIVQ